jgi:ADP-dependent NAD(P)H-hydrate dehydratase / NAD(P)H-hydrate epimerase
MRDWDERAIEGLGIPERLLMESAGRAAARVIAGLYPEGRVVAAVGRGNNGGDAIVALRTLRTWGREVSAVLVDGGEARSRLLHGWELPIHGSERMERELAGAAVIVDGLLGTGASGPPREPYAAIIRAIAASGREVVALDGPSGIDFTTGECAGEAVRAAVTVTFGAPKRGLLRYPGRSHAGRIVVVEVGFPPLDQGGSGAELLTPAWTAAHVPPRAPDAHKGDAGAVAVVAGRSGMGGAAVMAAHAALRSGAGVVYVLTHDANRIVLQSTLPEAIFLDRDDSDSVAILAERADAIVAGPGMGTEGAARGLLARLLEIPAVPLVLDADAITLLAREPDMLREVEPSRVVLTPHPAEMARLLGSDTARVVTDPFAAAAEAVERYACAVLLKGAPSMVAAPAARTLVAVAGHSGVGTGGMGDTLAGVAGALLAAGAEPRVAAALALQLSGRAAEIAGRGRSLLPRDVAERLPDALREAPSSLPSGCRTSSSTMIDRRHPRPRDPRFPGQPDRRGGGHPLQRGARPRGGAERRLHRRARGGGAARRRERSATSGKGVLDAVENVEEAIAPALRGWTPTTRCASTAR